MKKKAKKAKRITKHTQLKVKTGVKIGECAPPCVAATEDFCYYPSS